MLPYAGIMRAAVDFEPSDKWFGQQAVYRISMGNFVSGQHQKGVLVDDALRHVLTHC